MMENLSIMAFFTDRYTDETVDMYDMDGNKLEGIINGGVKN